MNLIEKLIEAEIKYNEFMSANVAASKRYRYEEILTDLRNALQEYREMKKLYDIYKLPRNNKEAIQRVFDAALYAYGIKNDLPPQVTDHPPKELKNPKNPD